MASNVIDLAARRLAGAAPSPHPPARESKNATPMTSTKAPEPLADVTEWPPYLRSLAATPPEGTAPEIVDALDRAATEIERQIDALADAARETEAAQERAAEAEAEMHAAPDCDADDLYDALADLGLIRRGGTLQDALVELRWMISQTECAAAHAARGIGR